MGRNPRKPPTPGRKQQIGVCRICGTRGILTFEHVPAKAAFNRARVEIMNLEQWLARKDPGKAKRGRIQQRGMGDVVLCAECNNVTGRRYVPELQRWAGAAAMLLNAIPDAETEDRDPSEKLISFGLKGVRPLLFAKQFVAMILAINGGEFRVRNPGLAEFVLEPGRTGLPAGYDLYLALYRGPKSRQAGVSGRLNTETGAMTLLTEIAHPPFAYLLSIEEDEPALKAGKVTPLVNCGPDDVVDLDLELQVGFGHTIYPGDLRSRAQIDAEAAQDRADVAAMDGDDRERRTQR